MPVYEYECGACGHRFEEWQKMSDQPVKVCPKCAEPKVERLISQTSFHLKGGGWYSDLYSRPKGGAAPSGSSGSGGSGDSGGGESKGSSGGTTPEAKPSESKKPDPKPDGGKKTAAAS